LALAHAVMTSDVPKRVLRDKSIFQNGLARSKLKAECIAINIVD
jgi:hypothetical protein